MKNEEIKKAVSEIDDKFIMEADPQTTKKYSILRWKRPLQAGVTAAAVLAVAVLGGVTWKQSQIRRDQVQTAAPIVAYEDQSSDEITENSCTSEAPDQSSGTGNSENGSDNNDAQTAMATTDDKDDKNNAESSDKESDATVTEDGKGTSADSGKNTDAEDAGKAEDTGNAASTGNSSSTGNSGNSGNTGNSGNSGKTSDTGNSGKTDTGNSTASTSSDDNNRVVASSSTDIASIGEYKHAKNYGEVYDALSERYSGRYYGDDDLAINDDMVEYDEEAPAADFSTGSAASASESAKTADSADAGTGSDDYSTTNVMHDGVDEGDIAKIDGKYIYLLQNDCVSITDIRNGKPGKKTKIEIGDENTEYYFNEMYVHDDVLVVVATEYTYDIPSYSDDYDWMKDGFVRYSYNAKTDTVALCYDISDRNEAKYMGRVTQDGYYNTSRLIGDKFYLFTNYDMYRPLDMTKEEALEDVSQFVPCINDDPIACKDIFIKDVNSSSCVISSFDIDDCKTIIDTKSVVNGYGSIYVSDKAIYFYEVDYTGYGYSTSQVTNIGKITLDGGHMYGGGAATVKGYIPDQFAIHEIDGNLMVLTTSFKNTDTTNTMYMLNPKMKEIGKITGIAKGEYVYAARYLGDYVYFITYRSVDPLFVADISDPSNPKLLGEVEIEGYSDYLHIWDENHVLGLGFETVDNGYGGVKNAGIKLVMFDVTDPLNPVIENTLVLEDEDYSDAIAYNYKALLVSPSKNLIGFSTMDYDKDYDNFYSYYVFSYSKEKGFKTKLDASLDGYYFEYRGLYSGDNFYLVKPGEGKIDHYKM